MSDEEQRIRAAYKAGWHAGQENVLLEGRWVSTPRAWPSEDQYVSRLRLVTGSKSGTTRLAGHTLTENGQALGYVSRTPALRYVVITGRVGRTAGSCGEVSGTLQTTAERRRWHTQHKAEM